MITVVVLIQLAELFRAWASLVQLQEQLPCLAFGLTVTVRLADCEGEICCEEVGKHCCTDVGLTSAQVSQYLRRGDMSRPLDM